MKSILKFGMAIAVMATLSSAWATVPGDAVFFSISPTDPNAGSTLNFTGSGQTGSLYIWVTSAGGTNDATNDAITPMSTTYNGSVSAGASALNLSGSQTAGPAGVYSLNTVTYDNPALSGKNTNRWSAISTPTTGVSGAAFTNQEANAALPNLPNTVPAGTQVGLATSNSGVDPLYFPGVTVPNGSTPGAWKVGTVAVTSGNTAGAATLSLAAGGLGVTKSTTGNTKDMTSLYSYGNATINLSLGRVGDLTGATLNTTPNNIINAVDINQIYSDINNATTHVATEDYRGATPPPPLTPDGVVNQFDVDHLVGSLVDTALGTGTGTHYGDADLNGNVDSGDLVLVRGGLGSAFGTPSWQLGDFNGNGNIDSGDLVAVRNNLGQSGGTGQLSVVPEPTSIGLLGIGALAMFFVRRRKSS